jgi:hypothetical protein
MSNRLYNLVEMLDPEKLKASLIPIEEERVRLSLEKNPKTKQKIEMVNIKPFLLYVADHTNDEKPDTGAFYPKSDIAYFTGMSYSQIEKAQRAAKGLGLIKAEQQYKSENQKIPTRVVLVESELQKYQGIRPSKRIPQEGGTVANTVGGPVANTSSPVANTRPDVANTGRLVANTDKPEGNQKKPKVSRKNPSPAAQPDLIGRMEGMFCSASYLDFMRRAGTDQIRTLAAEYGETEIEEVFAYWVEHRDLNGLDSPLIQFAKEYLWQRDKCRAVAA